MRKITYLLNVFAITGILATLPFACQKVEEVSFSKADILTSTNWSQTGFTVSPGIDIILGYTYDPVSQQEVAIAQKVTDLYSFYNLCERDNILHFNEDGKFTVENGLLRCDETDTQIIFAGEWILDSDETSLAMLPHKETPYYVLNDIFELSNDIYDWEDDEMDIEVSSPFNYSMREMQDISSLSATNLVTSFELEYEEQIYLFTVTYSMDK